jgi:16S rRNA (uracil1498-N3)-methyltransferase
MIRRVHVADLHPGSIALPAAEAHHVRDVLRLEIGSPLELFNDTGQTATGIIKHLNPANVVVEVESVKAAVKGRAIRVIVASAIPKGDRADWMIEKLAELGVARFIPLAAERSVVLPAGRNKIERWERTAIESAKQSRRAGVMSIAALTPLEEVVGSARGGWYLSTAGDATPVRSAIDRGLSAELTLFIGPEGGWTDGEIVRMNAAGLIGVSLTSTVLRVETAAVVAAALVLCMATADGHPQLGPSGTPIKEIESNRFTETHSPPNSDSAWPSSR